MIARATGVRAIARALALALALAPIPALAAPPRVALTWTAPETCPSADRITNDIERLLGASTGPRKPPLAVTARVTQEAEGRLTVHIEADAADGSDRRVRDLYASSCDALADATATILAFMIDPEAAAAAPPLDHTSPPALPVPPPPAPPPPTTPTAPTMLAKPSIPEPLPVTPPPPLPAARSRFHPAFVADVMGVVDGGSAPGIGGGVAGDVGLRLADVTLGLGVLILPDRSAVLAQRPSTGGDVSLVAGSVSVAYNLWPASRFKLGPAVGYELGRLHATGFGVTSPGSGNTLWSAVRLGGGTSYRVFRGVSITARGEAVFPTIRETFVLENVGSVYRPGAVAGRGALGLEVEF